MLTQENVDQIFEEHEVWERDSEATGQQLNLVVYTMAWKRSLLFERDPRLTDGVFAAWAICLPFFPQPESYTHLMAERRRNWFTEVELPALVTRAMTYFEDSLLELEFDQLASIVAAEDAVERIQRYLGSPELPDGLRLRFEESEAETIEAEPEAETADEEDGLGV